MQNTLSSLAAAIYIVCLFIPGERRWLLSAMTVCAWLLQAVALALNLNDGHAIRLGFAMMLSTAMWISVFVYWLENQKRALDGLRILLFPQVALATILPVFFSGTLFSLDGKPALFPWHIVVATLAYSTLTIAAYHAVVMTLQDAHLHQRGRNKPGHWLTPVMEHLPALMAMERLLFKLILLGFVFLTLTVVSGIIFSEEVLGVAFKFDHKTVLSLLSWLLFGILLAGRHWRGWRGRTVLNITISGFIALMLAYVGSRFVLEVLLHRSLS
jgi:ABC-type uncharacterized transport system permease subunit